MRYEASSGLSPRFTDGELRINILGEFAIALEGRALNTFASRTHARRLIQYLASSHRGTESRPILQALLWPDSEESRGRNRLHHTLHGLRRAFGELPSALRPEVFVQDERVHLVLPRGVRLDWSEHTAVIDADETDAEHRLQSLGNTFEQFSGELAPDWTGQPEIESRRAWLARRRDCALEEAVDLACELGRYDSAIRFARLRTHYLPDNLHVQVAYALLLRECGRADTALLFCLQLRSQLVQDDPAAVSQVDELIRQIQIRSNRENAVAPMQETKTEPVFVTRHTLPAPCTPIIGYGSLLDASERLLCDPYTSILALVGPPGAGKSLLASHVAYRCQKGFRHGAVTIDVSSCANGKALETALGLALQPLVGHVPATTAALHAALAGKELLIALDGLAPHSCLLERVHDFALRHAELRWLITCRAPLALRGERCLRVDPRLLLEPEENGAPTPAAQILAARLRRKFPLTSVPAWGLLEQLAQLIDGLPRALEIAADKLEAMAPVELVARLQQDPAMLLRVTGARSATSNSFALNVSEWLAAATPSEREALAMLAMCHSWLTREDLHCLVGGSADELDALIEQGTSRHHLCRQVRQTVRGQHSVYRVPRLLLAVPEISCDVSTAAEEKIACWIEAGPTRNGATAAGQIFWFEERRADVAVVVERWMRRGESGRVQAFCLKHLSAWLLTQYPREVLPWLDAGLAVAQRTVQAQLLLARGRIRLRLNQQFAACDDARRALGMLNLDSGSEPSLRQEALSLLLRIDITSEADPRLGNALGNSGLEAAEELLRVAQLAVRHGHYANALSVCEKSINLFAHFDIAHGQVRGHRYAARIALAVGDLQRVERSLDAAVAVAPKAARSAIFAQVELVRAELDLHQMQPAAALARVNAVTSQHEYAAQDLVAARGLQIAAWAHFALAAMPLALGLCREAHRLALGGAHAALLVDAHVLEALISARLGRSQMALQHIAAALERFEGERRAIDLQFDLVNAAELASLLGRPFLSASLLTALAKFGHAPQQALRPWIAHRACALRASLGLRADAVGAPSRGVMLLPSDAFRLLIVA